MAGDVREVLPTANEIEITVTGRKSGREISHPVWFVHERQRLYLVPVTGSDSDWYRNIRKTPRIRVTANGSVTSTSATPITDAARVEGIVERFRDKYGAEQIKAHYPKHNVAVEVALE
jgi:deazaflavin-dependent oxidoreductase (nitroreductase family)